jgi:hypothetical protein
MRDQSGTLSAEHKDDFCSQVRMKMARHHCRHLGVYDYPQLLVRFGFAQSAGWIQNPVPARECRFKSGLWYYGADRCKLRQSDAKSPVFPGLFAFLGRGVV